MTKEQIKEKAINIGENNLDRCFGSERDYGVTCALNMAEWLLQNIQIVKLHNAYNHDLFENFRFKCLEEQKEQLLLSLKDYIKMEEELTDYGTVVKMEIKIMK